jgi:hypothetical protein
MAPKRQKDIDAEENYGEVTTEPVSLDPDAEKAATGDRDKSTQELEQDGGKPGDTQVLAGDRQEQGQISAGAVDVPDPKPYAAVQMETVVAVFMWNGLGRHPDQPDNSEVIEIPDGKTVAPGYVYDRDIHEFCTVDELRERREPKPPEE